MSCSTSKLYITEYKELEEEAIIIEEIEFNFHFARAELVSWFTSQRQLREKKIAIYYVNSCTGRE